MSGSNNVPIGSMCTTGFNETRPSRFAVSSPSWLADQACAASCTVSEKIRTRKGITRSERVRSGNG